MSKAIFLLCTILVCPPLIHSQMRCFECTSCPEEFDPRNHRLTSCTDGGGEGSGEEGSGELIVVQSRQKDDIFLDESRETFDESSLVLVQEFELEQESTPSELDLVSVPPFDDETSSGEEPEQKFMCFKVAFVDENGASIRVDRGCVADRQFPNETCSLAARTTDEKSYRCYLCDEEGCNYAGVLAGKILNIVVFVGIALIFI